MNFAIQENPSADITRIMIVDDDIDILDSLRDVLELESDSFEIKTASNFDSAIILARTYHPDIALLDIKIGKDIGLNLVPDLKQNAPHIKCIMMTAFRDSEYAVEAVRKGADDYLFKPLETESLIKTLYQYSATVKLEKNSALTERRFRTIFEQSFQNTYILSPDGKIMDLNSTSIKFTHTDRESMIGQAFWDTPPFSAAAITRSKVEFLLANLPLDGYVEYGMEIPADNEQLLYLDFSAKPILSSNNDYDSIIVEITDNTQIYRAKNTIAELNASLEAKVAERTIELERSITLLEQEIEQRRHAEASLMLAKATAEKASEAKTMFLSRVSHELRTPMNAILGFTQLLEMEDLTATQLDYLSEVHNASVHLLSMINEILDLSRIESGSLDIQLGSVPVQQTLAECISLIAPLARNKGIEITLQNTEDYTLAVDPKRLKQILINLLSNAIKYNTEKGFVHINLLPLDTQQLRLSVEDSGIGIPAELQHRIFNPFDMLGREFHHEGTGIGLTVTKKLVEAMNGSISFDSRVDKGSTFYICLPLEG